MWTLLGDYSSTSLSDCALTHTFAIKLQGRYGDTYYKALSAALLWLPATDGASAAVQGASQPRKQHLST